MRHLVYMVFIVLVAQISTVYGAKDLPWEKELPYEQMTIVYNVSGIESGEETLYIRDNGREQATYRTTVTKMMGMTVSDKSIEFMTPDFIYSFDLQANEGYKSVNPQKLMRQEYEKLSAPEQKKVNKNAKKIGTVFTQSMGGEVEQNVMKILGYDCDKITVMGGAVTYLLHDTDIPLRMEVNMMGMKMLTEATSIKKKIANENIFTHPEGIVAQNDPEADQMAQMIAQHTMATLKDPETAKNKMGGAMQMPTAEKDMTEEDKAMMEQAGEMMKNLQNIFGN
jgi:hypothetical protein